jgi:molecular chaperone GrpE
MKQKEQQVANADEPLEPDFDRAQPVHDEEDEPIHVYDKRRRFDKDESEAGAPAAGEAEHYPSVVEELQNRLKQAEEQAEKIQLRFNQAKAELSRETDELRARLQRNAEARLETFKGELFQRLLEVADNLSRAIVSAENGADPATLLAGVKATHALLLRQLESEGVKPLKAYGEPFDPAFHEAVDTVAVAPDQDGKVVAVYQAGYKFGDRLLRPAVVRVGRSD